MAKTANEAQVNAYDPWKEQVSIMLPKRNDGDQDFQLVMINGKGFQVPCGKLVRVPRPVWDVLIRSERAQEITRRHIEESNEHHEDRT